MSKAILIVDDDPLARRAIERILSSEPRLQALQARTLQASDGDKALTLVAEEHPDMVITDLFMPGMDGFTLCRELRQGKAPEGMPILVISGVYKDPAMARSLTQELRVSFLAKPIDARMLADAVLELLPEDARGAVVSVSSSELQPVTAEKVPGADADGILAEGVMARLLFDHIEGRSTGTLVLARGQMRKEIYLRDGRVVGADSNIREQALGALLKGKGFVTEDRLQYLLAETKRRKQKMGTVLVELGWMTPEEVLQTLAAQARKRVVDALRWIEGSWSFVRGDTFGDRVIEHAVDAPKLIFSGLRRTARLEAVAARFDAHGARPVILQPGFETFRPAFEAVHGTEVLPLLGPGTPLASLVLSADPQKVAVAVESLLLSGMAEMGQADPSLAAADGDTPTMLTSFDRLGEEMSLPPSAAFDDDLAPGGSQTGARPIEERLDDDSGQVDLFATPKTKPGIGPIHAGPQGPVETRTALLREFLEIHGKSLYEVLGIAPDATQEEIARAYERKTRRFADAAFVDQEDPGADAAKREAVRGAYERAFRVLLDPTLRRGYDAEQEPQVLAGGTDALGAELAFGEGQALLQAGKPELALARFERAVAARPDQSAYHAYLGWTLFSVRGQPAMVAARERLEHALALDPSLATAHELFARLVAVCGDPELARRHLEQALELDPEGAGTAWDLLVSVNAELGDAAAAERFYRRILATLSDRAVDLRRRVWRELGGLYETKLAHPERARTAWQNAARLSPNDLTAQRKVVELSAQDPTRWREMSRALAAEWRERPRHRAPGVVLLEALLKAGHNDAASLVAAGLALRGQANGDAQLLADEGRPRLLRRLPGPLDAATRALVAFSGEDPELEALIGAMAEAGAIPAVDTLAGDEPLETAAMPGPFARHLRYVCEVLGAGFPAVHRRPALGNDARVTDTFPPALLVGPGLLSCSDGVELGFRLGRALSLAPAGRASAAARAGKQLRPYLQAGLAIARGLSHTSEPEVEDVLVRIEAAEGPARARLIQAARQLVRGRQSVNLRAWIRAIGRTGSRIGLVLCGDLLRAGRIVAAEGGQEALDDLLAFALSIEHFDLREQLGTATVI